LTANRIRAVWVKNLAVLIYGENPGTTVAYSPPFDRGSGFAAGLKPLFAALGLEPVNGF
jgi:hypothetical protein